MAFTTSQFIAVFSPKQSVLVETNTWAYASVITEYTYQNAKQDRTHQFSGHKEVTMCIFIREPTWVIDLIFIPSIQKNQKKNASSDSGTKTESGRQRLLERSKAELGKK